MRNLNKLHIQTSHMDRNPELMRDSGCAEPAVRVRNMSEKNTKARNGKGRQANREAKSMPISRRMKAIRGARGMTQAESAARASVSERQWQNWESGRSRPYAKLPQIASALMCIVEDLLDFDGPIPPPLAPQDEALAARAEPTQTSSRHNEPETATETDRRRQQIDGRRRE